MIGNQSETKKEYVEQLIQKIGCFTHAWTPWKAMTDWEGEGWERVKTRVYRRECSQCQLYQAQ